MYHQPEAQAEGIRAPLRRLPSLALRASRAATLSSWRISMSDHAHSHDASGHGHDDHDHGGLAKYVYVFAALCVLTAASFWTYADWPVQWPYHRQPAVGWAFMLAVACTKAMLVILFFMHVKYEASWKYVLTVPPAIMSILLM